MAAASNHVTTYLADTGGTRTYREMDCTGRTAILLGNERYGISRPVVRVRLRGRVDPHAGPGRLAQRVDLRGRAALRGAGAQIRLVSPDTGPRACAVSANSLRRWRTSE